MARVVKRPRAPRTRRAEQAEQTRRRILEAAGALFANPGYAAATIDAVARQADVADETVYSRFGNKSNLLAAILEPAAVATYEDVAVIDLPESAAIGSSTDQHEQVRLMARLSRTILERTAQIHRVLHAAAFSDPKAAELQQLDQQRRHQAQSGYIDMLVANGALRDRVTRTAAADTYATLANPETYDFLTEQRGWSTQRYEDWLADSLTRLLLP
ncbi:MAG: TetR/AcrR family transcriptional regulator [Pseudonocardia sp.]|nr:TetR/AcrR family transcriptional regulator [Pseudonocardia sp.]